MPGPRRGQRNVNDTKGKSRLDIRGDVVFRLSNVWKRCVAPLKKGGRWLVLVVDMSRSRPGPSSSWLKNYCPGWQRQRRDARVARGSEAFSTLLFMLHLRGRGGSKIEIIRRSSSPASWNVHKLEWVGRNRFWYCERDLLMGRGCKVKGVEKCGRRFESSIVRAKGRVNGMN